LAQGWDSSFVAVDNTLSSPPYCYESLLYYDTSVILPIINAPFLEII